MVEADQRRRLALDQALPLEAKISRSKARIRTWYELWQGRVHVAWSGGKDSSVLLHLVRSRYSFPSSSCGFDLRSAAERTSGPRRF